MSVDLQKILLGSLILFAGAGPGAAVECTAARYAESKSKVELAFSAGIFLGSSTAGGKMQMFVSGPAWRGMRPDSRINMVGMAQCTVSGVGKALSAMDIITADTQRLVARIKNGEVILVAD